MNLIDCSVTKVVGDPYQAYGKWWVKVIADAYGRPMETSLYFATEEEAKAITVGYKFVLS